VPGIRSTDAPLFRGPLAVYFLSILFVVLYVSYCLNRHIGVPLWLNYRVTREIEPNMDPALAAQLYPPEYLAEDRSRQLTNTAIAFAVLATVFVGLFFTSRVINKTVNGPDFWLMPPAYIACLGQVTISFCKPSDLPSPEVRIRF